MYKCRERKAWLEPHCFPQFSYYNFALLFLPILYLSLRICLLNSLSSVLIITTSFNVSHFYTPHPPLIFLFPPLNVLFHSHLLKFQGFANFPLRFACGFSLFFLCNLFKILPYCGAVHRSLYQVLLNFSTKSCSNSRKYIISWTGKKESQIWQSFNDILFPHRFWNSSISYHPKERSESSGLIMVSLFLFRTVRS